MNGPFGNKFPYTNFHEMNLDWMIQVAKDFLDQYTHIQQIIEDGEQSLQDLTESGLQQLQDKADNLETLLQEWYNEHSEDIADQLAGALSDLNDWYTTHEGYLDQYVTDSIAAFNTAAENKAAATIATIPDDYTTLSNTVTSHTEQIRMIRQADTEYIPAICNQKLLTTQWVIGGLNNSGVISTGQVRRITTFDYMKSETAITLNDTLGGLHFIVCTYTDAKVLINRTSTKSVPANTFFKVTVYGDESADLVDPWELAQYVTYTVSDYVRENNTAVQVYRESIINEQSYGITPLPSNFIIGNLYSDGSLR